MRIGRARDSERTATSVAVAPAGPPPSAGDRRRLGEVLVGAGALDEATLEAALAEQASSTGAAPVRLGRMLVGHGVVTEEALAHAVATQAGLQTVDLSHQGPGPAAAAALPETVARRLTAVPLGVDDDGVTHLAVEDPAPAVAEELRRTVGGPVALYVTTPTQVRRAVDALYRALAGVQEQVEAFTALTARRGGPVAVQHRGTAQQHGAATGRGAGPAGPADGAEVDVESAPVVRVVTMLLTQALRDRASDVHLEPQDGQVRVRLRIDGTLHDVLTLPAEMAPAVASRLKIMAGMNIVERRRPQDGQFTTSVDDRTVDVRVATVGTVWGEKVVLRLLDTSRPLYRLGDLGMPADTHAAYSRMIRSPYGMVICAGPTGSGKTTTLYASMTEVNGVERNITTIEDPVEYVFPSINQIQINEAAGVTFATGLKAILRQDPDMILVGEMRDVETARIAVQSALTGHFVLSSLHATDAVSALYRFLDMGIESFLVASSVIGVVGQRLVRRTCRYCRVPHRPSAEELAFLAEPDGGAAAGRDPRLDPAALAAHRFWVGEGCNFCAGTGYSDRVGVYELLTVTEEMRQLVVAERPSHDELRRLAVRQGMRPLRSEGVRLVLDGVTTAAEIVRSMYTL